MDRGGVGGDRRDVHPREREAVTVRIGDRQAGSAFAGVGQHGREVLSLRHAGGQIGERRRRELDRVRACARSREALDRFSAEARSEDEMFGPAGRGVDGLDGMVAQCVLARPCLQELDGGASRDCLVGIVQKQLVRGRTEVQLIRREVAVAGARERLRTTYRPSLRCSNAGILKTRRRSGPYCRFRAPRPPDRLRTEPR